MNAVDPVGPPRWERFTEGHEGWLVTRYQDVRAVLADPRMTRDATRAAAARAAVGLPTWPPDAQGRGTALLQCDPPKHRDLRRAVDREFSTRRTARLRPRIEAIANDLLDTICARGAADLTQDFALPFTGSVLCEFAGLPMGDWQQFRAWVHDVHAVGPSPASRRRRAEASTGMDEYFKNVIEEARRRGAASVDRAGDGVFVRLLVDADKGEGLSEDDLIAFGRSLIVGGFESTKALIVTGMLSLLGHRDQLEILRADPQRIPLAVEEFLRWEPPFPRIQERYPLEELEIGGIVIGQGHPVVIDLAAANRDPKRFRHPATLDITDVDPRQVAFGPGTHHCLGAPLARLEAEVAIRTLLTRLPDVRLGTAPDRLAWPAGILACPGTVPVTFSPSPPIGAGG